MPTVSRAYQVGISALCHDSGIIGVDLKVFVLTT